MKNLLRVLVAIIPLLAGPMLGQGVRRPVCAGSYYDALPDQLSRHLDDMLAWVESRPAPAPAPVAFIVPHAGYVYSGVVAAHAYRMMQGRDIKTVVVLGVAHRHAFQGISIYAQGGYATPLGTVSVDESLAASLTAATGFGYVPAAHREEHSIEVQVPFIQKVLPRAKIVPVLLGLPTRDSMQRLATALAEFLPGKNALIVVSTDMSHYLSKADANTLDSQTIRLIQNQDIEALAKKVTNHENIMCGGAGVVTALLYAARLGRPRTEILKYADSSAAGGDEKKVVGYLSAAIYALPDEDDGFLAAPARQELLRLARAAVELMVRENQILQPQTQNSGLHTPKGAFVTLKKHGRLRGCIGFTEAIAPLYQTVTMAAVYAATRDHRFSPVQVSELKDLEIEISVLTPPRLINGPHQIEVGKHGLIISRGERRGLLLPQVPVENHWDRDTFLQQACLKAGLPRYAWRWAEIYVFEAQVFH
jgi:AmmeMemoRadiSam system protein B/AmmeMemoRadiSam system protein A